MSLYEWDAKQIKTYLKGTSDLLNARDVINKYDLISSPNIEFILYLKSILFKSKFQSEESKEVLAELNSILLRFDISTVPPIPTRNEGGGGEGEGVGKKKRIGGG